MYENLVASVHDLSGCATFLVFMYICIMLLAFWYTHYILAQLLAISSIPMHIYEL